MAEMLKTFREIIISEGKVSYHEGLRAWNTVRLKAAIVEMFPQLREKQERINYRVELYRNHDDAIRTLVKLRENGDGVPLLLYLHR